MKVGCNDGVEQLLDFSTICVLEDLFIFILFSKALGNSSKLVVCILGCRLEGSCYYWSILSLSLITLLIVNSNSYFEIAESIYLRELCIVLYSWDVISESRQMASTLLRCSLFFLLSSSLNFICPVVKACVAVQPFLSKASAHSFPTPLCLSNDQRSGTIAHQRPPS